MAWLRSHRLVVAWVIGHAAVLLGATAWWLSRNELPDGYQNEFIHLFTLGEIVFRLRDEGFAAARPFIQDEYWPPLMHLLPGLAVSVLEPSRALATFVGALVVLPLLAASAALGHRHGGPAAACLATSLTALSPIVFGNVRRYEPNILLGACVLGAAWLLATRRERSDRAFVIGVGLAFGLGMLADRLVFAVYLAPAVAWLWWREREHRRWLGALAIGAVACSWYYVRFFALHLGEVTSQLGGEISAGGATSEIGVLSIRGLLYYPLSWVDGGAGLAFAALIFVGLGLWIRERDGGDPVLEPLLVGGLVLFTLVAKKQPYYGLPLLLAAIPLASAGLAKLPRRWVLLAAVAAIGVHQLLFLTAGRGLVPTPGRWAALSGAPVLPAGWLGNEYVLAAEPAPSGVDPERIARLCRATGGPTVLFSEGQGAYEGQLMPTLRLALDTRALPGLVMEPEAWVESVDGATCFVYVAGAEEGPAGPQSVDRRWPTESSVTALLRQWNQQDPTPELLAALERARPRAQLRERWISERQETVHVYALARPRGPDLH